MTEPCRSVGSDILLLWKVRMLWIKKQTYRASFLKIKLLSIKLPFGIFSERDFIMFSVLGFYVSFLLLVAGALKRRPFSIFFLNAASNPTSLMSSSYSTFWSGKGNCFGSEVRLLVCTDCLECPSLENQGILTWPRYLISSTLVLNRAVESVF